MKVKDAIRIIKDGQESLDSTLWEYRKEINDLIAHIMIDRLNSDDKNTIDLIKSGIEEDDYDNVMEELGDEWEIIEQLLKIIDKLRD